MGDLTLGNPHPHPRCRVCDENHDHPAGRDALAFVEGDLIDDACGRRRQGVIAAPLRRDHEPRLRCLQSCLGLVALERRTLTLLRRGCSTLAELDHALVVLACHRFPRSRRSRLCRRLELLGLREGRVQAGKNLSHLDACAALHLDGPDLLGDRRDHLDERPLDRSHQVKVAIAVLTADDHRERQRHEHAPARARGSPWSCSRLQCQVPSSSSSKRHASGDDRPRVTHGCHGRESVQCPGCAFAGRRPGRLDSTAIAERVACRAWRSRWCRRAGR